MIILGQDFEEHLNNIRLVLQRLCDAGLRLKPSKCWLFFQQQVKYLGHIISRNGISTDPDKTNRVLKWPPPSSKREVQQFLGLTSYYRWFVKNFAHIARPLHQLTQRTASFAWTHPCQEAFNELCKRLCSAPILAYPDFSRPFILDTDASDGGIGAVLSMRARSGWLPMGAVPCRKQREDTVSLVGSYWLWSSLLNSIVLTCPAASSSCALTMDP